MTDELNPGEFDRFAHTKAREVAKLIYRVGTVRGADSQEDLVRKAVLVEALADYFFFEEEGDQERFVRACNGDEDAWLCLVDFARDVAVRLPDARFVLVDGDVGVHQYQHDQIIAEMRKFLDAGIVSRQPPGPMTFRAVLFTDLAGHTAMMSRLGDERGRAVLREHERITRDVLKAHGGTEVKTMGDGFMASFGSVTRAVECAVALQRAFAERNASARPEVLEGLSVRVGLNAGEPIEEDGDLFGATVILASRIAAKAEGGEILVADTVRGLCSGKGFLFADRGEFVAKGFEEPVRVYEVSWRER